MLLFVSSILYGYRCRTVSHMFFLGRFDILLLRLKYQQGLLFVSATLFLQVSNVLHKIQISIYYLFLLMGYYKYITDIFS